ncbi:hypothetical protein F4780DRAFT_210176 [Xylariomycetidae sp. FL0641]|nr:hypothetical protein F4780DRAFT_210176 [Xylariomycetidae sp. FL0641]
MAKKNKSRRAEPIAAPETKEAVPPKRKIVKAWRDYFKKGELEDWQRLMGDLGFETEFPSKSKCRKALGGVWVNIHDFLDAIENQEPVHHFLSEVELAIYTRETGKVYPKSAIPQGSPLRKLLAQIRQPRGGHKAKRVATLVGDFGGLAIA